MAASFVPGRFELLALAALASGPRTGHRLALELARRTRRHPGELEWLAHDTLRALVADGLVREHRALGLRGPRRRYELTRKGRARLDSERRAWLGLARAAVHAA
jgi:DNA-binding PadR family transcriptional regulator